MAETTGRLAWEPQPAILSELAGYLRNALNPRDPVAQKQATLMLTQAKTKPETARYLTYIFANGQTVQELKITPSEVIVLRSSAAINLKNVIRSNYKFIDQDARLYIRGQVLSCLNDSDSQIRSLTGTVITELVLKGGVLGWPEIFPELLAIAANEKGNISDAAQQAAMNALAKVCEDRKDDLSREHQGEQPLNFIIPRLLNLCGSENAGVRALTVACLNSFIAQQSQAMLQLLDAILDRFFQLARDESPDVRRNLCRAFVLIVDVNPHKIFPHMNGLVEYLCIQQQDKSEPESALEAAEFWLAVSEHDEIYPSLESHLERIIPVLLESMVYDEDSIIRLSGTAEDAATDDREEDIKPHFASRKYSRGMANGRDTVEDLEDGEIEDDGDDNDTEIDDQWNLRKCSAAALDNLASKFQQRVFDIALGYLNQNLTNPEWPYRESAVLAMGAIAEGCIDSVAPALPNIVPYLTSLLDDSEPSVRLITCWALGRYSAWALNLPEPNDRQRYLNAILNGILDRMLDKVKKVQTAAASALASIGEKAGRALEPHAQRIVQTFSTCFEFYKARNLYVLYDCVQTFADQLGTGLRDPQLTNVLMPAIIGRWRSVPDHSQEMFPLHECLSYITAALGETFSPFAPPIFARCIGIIRQNLEQLHLNKDDDTVDQPDKDFLVTSLDLLSAIIQALDSNQSSELVRTSQPRFFDLLIYCMGDSNNDVRQSAYALLGDCAVKIFDSLHGSLPKLIPVVINQIDTNSLAGSGSGSASSVLNNACWSLGEIAMRYTGQEIEPYVDNIYPRLKAVLDQRGVPASVAENAIITIGRLGIHAPEILSKHLGEFVGQFLSIIARVAPTEEKGHAFLGLNRVIGRNPYAMSSSLVHYLEASLEYSKTMSNPQVEGETIGQSFQQVMSGYKRLDETSFERLLTQMPREQQERLRQAYDLY